MLNSKKVKIGDRDITVCEVKVKRVLQLLPFLGMDDSGQDDTVEKGFMENMDELLQECCGIGRTELVDMHGSELERLWDAFREVNGFFFRTANRLGLEEKIKDLLGILFGLCGETFASLLSEVMRDASITGSAGSTGQTEIPSGTGTGG